MYLAGYTMQEIAEAVGIPQQTVSDTLPKITTLEKSVKNMAEFQDSEFETPRQSII